MAVADTAKLAVDMSLTGNFKSALKANEQGLSSFTSKVDSVAVAGVGKLQTGIGKVQTAVGKFGGALGHAKSQIGGLLTGPLGVIGLGAGLFGVAGALDATVNASRDFAAAMELVHTQAHATQAEVDSMSKSVLDLAGSVATSPNELAAGLYHLESAGFRGAKALEALKIAAEGAKVGHANLEDVTNALDAVLVAGGKDATNMSAAMGALNAVVGAGDMRMQDLADAMGTGILAAARTFGLSLRDVGAALAVLGDNNIRGAEAATKLRMSFALMAAPSSAAAKSLKKIGLGALDLANDMRKGGLVLALEDLKKHLDSAGLTASQQAYVISHAFGGGKSGTTIELLLNQLDRLKTKEKDVAEGAKNFGSDWDATVQTAQYKWDKFNTILGVTAVKLGNVFLPLITDAMGKIGDWVSAHQSEIVNFAKDLTKSLRGVAHVLTHEVFPVLGMIAGAAKTAWDGIPAPLRDLIVKGIVADRTFKFLFGFSPIKFAAGALASGLGAVLGKFIGRGVVQPVFVTNPGGIGGGIPGIAGSAAAGGLSAAGGVAGLSTLLPLALPFALLLVPAIARALDPNAKAGGFVTHGQMSPKGGSVPPNALSGKTKDDLGTKANPIVATLLDRGGRDQGTNPLSGKIADDLGTKSHPLVATLLDRGGRETGFNSLPGKAADDLAIANSRKDPLLATLLDRGDRANFDKNFNSLAGKLKDDRVSLGQLLKANADKIASDGLEAMRSIWAPISRAMRTLGHTNDPKKIAAAVKELEQTLVKEGHGNAANTKTAVKELEAQLKRTHDPTLQDALRHAISDLKAKIPGREYAERQIAKADKIVRSTESTADKIRQLQAIENDLKNHKLPGAIHGLEGKITALKTAQVAAQHSTTQAIKDKDLSVRITVPITNRTIVNTRNLITTVHTLTNFYSLGSGVHGLSKP